MKSVFLRYNKYGYPSSVLEIAHKQLAKISPNEVLLTFLGAPINPSDYNQIEGKYPIKPKLPAIGGNEGSAAVIDVGSNVKTLKVGDTVIPAIVGFGTWRTTCTALENDVKRIPPSIGSAASSMFAVNPCTAYRMIEDFKKPPPDGWVIQNGSNSGVGRAVIQLCKVQNIRTINIIRDRDDAQTLKNELLALGADVVFTASEHRDIELFCKENLPHLALNMVGGRDTIQLLKCLGKESSLVTYGAMSNSPLSVPFGLQVFKNITLHSYWMTRWTERYARSTEEDEMFGKIADYFISGELTPPPHNPVSLFDYKEACDNAFKIKQLFVVEKTLSDSRMAEVD